MYFFFSCINIITTMLVLTHLQVPYCLEEQYHSSTLKPNPYNSSETGHEITILKRLKWKLLPEGILFSIDFDPPRHPFSAGSHSSVTNQSFVSPLRTLSILLSYATLLHEGPHNSDQLRRTEKMWATQINLPPEHRLDANDQVCKLALEVQTMDRTNVHTLVAQLGHDSCVFTSTTTKRSVTAARLFPEAETFKKRWTKWWPEKLYKITTCPFKINTEKNTHTQRRQLRSQRGSWQSAQKRSNNATIAKHKHTPVLHPAHALRHSTAASPGGTRLPT